MSAVEDPPFVAGTLAWCNERRAEKGMDPLEQLPKGTRSDPNSCPCGKASGLFVGGLYWGETAEEAFYASIGHWLPRVVTDFVIAFDAGELPQYDEYPKEGSL